MDKEPESLLKGKDLTELMERDPWLPKTVLAAHGWAYPMAWDRGYRVQSSDLSLLSPNI